MKAFAANPAFKADVIAAMVDDIPDTTAITTAAKGYGIAAWHAHVAATLHKGLPEDTAKRFALEAISAINPGADLDRMKPDFMVLALKCVLGLCGDRRDPLIKAAKLLSDEWWLRKGANLDRHKAAIKRMVGTRKISMDRAEASTKSAANITMRLSTEKIYADRVIAYQAARAALYACSAESNAPAQTIEPLSIAVAARTWLEVIGLLKFPTEKMTGNIKSRIAATAKAWDDATDESVTDVGYLHSHLFLASEFLAMTRWMK